MFSISRIRLPAIATALACALLVSALGGVAAAQTSDELRRARAQERYYQGSSVPADSHPQEAYLRSYGEPEPITAAQAPAPSDDGSPWLPIVLAGAAGFGIVAVGVSQRHRLRIRRRRAHAMT